MENFNAALMALPTSDRKIATEIAVRGGRFFAAVDPVDPTKVVLFDFVKKTASEWKNGN